MFLTVGKSSSGGNKVDCLLVQRRQYVTGRSNGRARRTDRALQPFSFGSTSRGGGSFVHKDILVIVRNALFGWLVGLGNT